MRPLYCFIDDSPFELAIFSEHIIPAAPGVDFVIGASYDQVKAQIGSRYPSLFLLDLYGRDPSIAQPSIPPKALLEREITQASNFEAIYSGLDDHKADVNEFLRRLFQAVDVWRRMFYAASRQSGQSTWYGVSNCNAVRADFPAAAAVGYTRKSLIMDAVEIIAAGFDGLTLKPNGPSDAAIREATARNATMLLSSWDQTVQKRFKTQIESLTLELFRAGLHQDASRVDHPEELSSKAQLVLGPRNLLFLEVASPALGH